MEVGWRSVIALVGMVVQSFLVTDCFLKTPARKILRNNSQELTKTNLGVQLDVQHEQVVMDNGYVRATLSIPEGLVTGIQYNMIDNLLEIENDNDNRGYWDIVWSKPGNPIRSDRLKGTSYNIITANEDQLELSFISTWDASYNDSGVPFIVDKRYVLLRGCHGLYMYAIYERLEGWPDINIDQTRIVFKLQREMFHFMAISDDRQRIMPMPQDREHGQPLAYPEAVLLTNPTNPLLIGEVDDKYQYSTEDKDNRVHGWICSDPPVGFWMITPSDEFRTGGPMKQDLTSHVGPTTLSMFVSTHYAGMEIEMQFRDGEPWKKVFGPVFIYLNSVSDDDDPLMLWEDAKEQMLIEVEKWPYEFPLSEDFPSLDQRGTVSGRLLLHDGYINTNYMTGSFAYVGLALPGEAGSWQRETKGYQFWVEADIEGYFLIRGVRAGSYNLYAWVPGFIGDYRYDFIITITSGCEIKLGAIIFELLRDGPTLWEIGVPDRTAAEFYVPDPNPMLMNQLYNNHPDKFRQYGLWERYTDLYPDQDLIYTIGVSNFQTDWFFAHVNRDLGNMTYQATTWQILFDLQNLTEMATYKFRIALASANDAELQVRFNDPDANPPHFTTGHIGKDNAIARHGIHGLYWLYNIDVPAPHLLSGSNSIFLTQSRSLGPFRGIMYDYIRFEGPPEMY